MAEPIYATKESFTEIFRQMWEKPSLDSFMATAREDIVLIQPMSKPLIGKAAATKEFRRILYRFPGIYGRIHRSAINDDFLYIDWTMIVPLGGKPLELPVVDRFEFEDGGVKRRIAYFDPSSAIPRILTNPMCLLRHVRALFLK